MNENFSSIINQYSFIRTALDRSSEEFVQQRMWEHNLIKRQRASVSFCKKISGINTVNISKLTNDDKSALEDCLRQNFLNRDANYFGKRDHIYLDLFD
jgi:23S rRNA A1618 N6-methylase RlmF